MEEFRLLTEWHRLCGGPGILTYATMQMEHKTRSFAGNMIIHARG